MKTRIFEAIAAELPVASREEIAIRFKPLNPDDYKAEFIEVIRRRIHHCEQNCLNNLAEAQVCNDGQTIVWAGGHFAIPVHAALIQALECEPHEWHLPVWQQIIRQMYEDEMQNEILFRVATETLAYYTIDLR